MAKCPIEEIAKRAGEAGVPFLVIGGYAVIAHGYVRTTDDLDLIHLILINQLDLNEPELRATILKHGNAEIYEKLQHACADK
jgi:hypothetical protein